MIPKKFWRDCLIEIFLDCGLHEDLVSCVGWTSAEEVYSGGDDHKILKWNRVTGEASTLVKLPADLFPLDMHWFPRSGGGAKQKGSDIFVLTSTDGEQNTLFHNP